MNRKAGKVSKRRAVRESRRKPPPIPRSIAPEPDERNDAPEDTPEDTPEDASEDAPEDAPEDVPEGTPEDAPEDTLEDTLEDALEDASEDDATTLVRSDDRKAQYDGIDWKRVPHLQIRDKEHTRGNPSWIYKYGWPLWHRRRQKRWWLCKYCHTHKMRGGEYDVHTSTSSAGTHISAKTVGHGYDRDGKIDFALPPNTSSILHRLQLQGVRVSQAVANELASSFSQKAFRQALIDWIVADNQALRVIETPSFRQMIAVANPLAAQSLWKSANSLRAHIFAEYHAMIPAVIQHLKKARSLIHISFDNWTSYGGKRALTGICVHHLNEQGNVEDYVLGLPQLHGCHSGENIAHVVAETLQTFEIDKTRLGYFVLDNATNNDTAIESLADKYDFWAPHRRLRCTCHILNLAAQLVIWGKDKEAFENDNLNMQVNPGPKSPHLPTAN